MSNSLFFPFLNEIILQSVLMASFTSYFLHAIQLQAYIFYSTVIVIVKNFMVKLI